MKTIRIGTRDSKLAMAQTDIVKEAILAYDSSIKVEIVSMKTTGDKILDKALDKIGGKGLFVKELDEALLNNHVDISVHSFKDMPMDENEQLPVVAVSKREDVRDVVLMKKGETLTKESVLGSCSKRRIVQLKDLGFKNFVDLRGNVQTRLKKCEDGICDGAVLAAAGIKRLNLIDKISRYFTVEEIIPAACQGIICVQARKGEDTSFLSKFNDEETFIIAKAERSFVKVLGGGCSAPIGAYATISGDEISLFGLYVDEKGEIKRMKMSEKLENAEKLGAQLANRIKEI